MGRSWLFQGGVAVDLLRLSQFVEIFECRVNRLFQKKHLFLELVIKGTVCGSKQRDLGSFFCFFPERNLDEWDTWSDDLIR